LAESLRGPQSSDTNTIVDRICQVFDTMQIKYRR